MLPAVRGRRHGQNRVRGVHRRSGGFALVVAIFVTGLVALLALSFAASVRRHVQITSNAVSSAAAEAAADAGISLGIANLLSVASNARRGAESRAVISCQLPSGATLSVEITDEGGRVDLNIAPRELLAALARGLGYGDEKAGTIATAIVDYRDLDDVLGTSDGERGGSERAAYQAAGRAGPANAAFETVEELGAVLGLTRGDMDRWTPFVTVRSGQRGVDPKSAAPALVAALASGASSLGVAAGGGGIGEDGIPRGFVSTSNGSAWRLRAVGHAPMQSGTFVREAVVTFSRPWRSAAQELESDLPESGVRARSAPVASGKAGTQPIAIIHEWRRGNLTSEGNETHNTFNNSGC